MSVIQEQDNCLVVVADGVLLVENCMHLVYTQVGIGSRSSSGGNRDELRGLEDEGGSMIDVVGGVRTTH